MMLVLHVCGLPHQSADLTRNAYFSLDAGGFLSLGP